MSAGSFVVHLMRCYPVSTRINHVANDDESARDWWSLLIPRIGYSRSLMATLRSWEIRSMFPHVIRSLRSQLCNGVAEAR